MEQQLAKIIAATPKAPPKTPAAITKALAGVRFKAATSGLEAAPKTGVSTQELFAAVYANPDDDAPRAALADFLQERGDPRGQFIALQLAPNQAETKAEQLELLRKHQRAWLGAFASHLTYLAYPSVSPTDPALKQPTSIELWWHRGFPAAALIEFTKPKFIALAGRAEWNTLVRVRGFHRLDASLPDDALSTFFGNLGAARVLDGLSVRQLELASRVKPLAARVRALTFDVRNDDPNLVRAALSAFTSLERLAIHFTEAEDVSIVSKVRFEGLRFLSLTGRHSNLALTVERTDGRWTPVGSLSERSAAELGKLPIELAR